MNIERPIQILVRRRAALGDAIMSTGVVRELKKRYSNCEIDLITDFPDAYRNSPHVRQLFTTSHAINPTVYDLYINLDDCYEFNPENHYLDSYFYRALGENTVDRSVELFDTDEDKTQILNFLNQNQLDQYIVVHMRNWYWELKNMALQTWFDVYAEVFEKHNNIKVVCVGGATDFFIDLPMFVDARGNLTPQQLKVLISGARCFVGTDSAPYHCAAATDTPIVALLTHLLPERIVPYRHGKYGWNTTAISAEIDCIGCNDRQARPVSQIICERGTMPCKDSFNSKAIANAIINTL
jgi:ADP-heptose:LPS heptosyltransferase